MTSSRLESELVDLRAHLLWPAEVDLAGRLRLAPMRPVVSRTRLALILVLAAAVLGIALIPPARQAVANLLEIAGIRIEFGKTGPLPPPNDLAPGVRVGVQTAAEAVDFQIQAPAALDPPSAVYLSETDLGPQVHLLWVVAGDLPQIGDSGIGLLLTQFRAVPFEPYFTKLVDHGTRVTEVDINGEEGFWFSGGPHVLIFNDGRHEEANRLTGNVLIWESDGVTYRLETVVDLEAATEIARSLAPMSSG
ncbi:MAG: hypothetical protein ACT4OP_11685 [Actinomycetota bacterium]